MFNLFRKNNKKNSKIQNKNIDRAMEDGDISMEELKMKQLYGAQIIDVRSKQEFDEGHINGAINIPDYQINKKIGKTLNNKNAEIVLYCQSGSRGRKAYKKLKRYGYTNVFNLYGGLDEWN